jgi:ATP-dependent RNA helicase DeaD
LIDKGKPVESEVKEERGSGRSQNVVHVLPRSMASVPRFLTGPLERIDPAAGTTQVLVITADPETAVAMSEAVLRMTGPAGIELLPVTTARRAVRLMSGRPVLAAAGSPLDLRELIRGSHLKLESVNAVVLAWADEILASSQDVVDALEAIMSELPKDAARIVVTSRSEGRVNAFAERYLRRARREVEEETEESAPTAAIQYVTVSRASRPGALRRLLDDLDPPSAAIVVDSDESETEVTSQLRTLGYGEGSDAVRVTRSEINPSTYAVIFYDVPASRAALAPATAAGVVTIATLVEPRQVEALKRVGGSDVKPYSLKSSIDTARAREAMMRRELSNVLDQGIASREVLALEPLLERYDGIEVAAAALRLLEKERTLRAAEVEERRPVADDRDRRPAFGKREGTRGSFERGGPPRGKFERGGDSPRGKFDRGGDSPRGKFDRGGDSPQGKFDRGDSPRRFDKGDGPRKFDRDRPPRRDDRKGPPRRGRP